MATERDIEALSVPFVSGVALASALPVSGLEWIWPCVAVSAGIFVLAAILMLGRCRPLWPSIPLFFLLGIFCYASSSLTDGLFPAPPSCGTSDALASLIDIIPFSHGDTAEILKALLLGRKQGVSRSVIGYFRASGASHILALSGLHLGVLYGILCRMLAPLGGRRGSKIIRFCATVGTSAFYVWMTGASASLVRAFLFIIIREGFRLLPGREMSSRAVLCLAVTLQLSFCPTDISSVGFQLSYLAMTGIVTVLPAIQGWYPAGDKGSGHNPVRKMWNAMALSISCQIFTGPLVWVRFHTFPKYFLLTNFLAMPLSEALIICGVACIALSGIGWCPELLVNITDWMARLLVACLQTISGM